MDAANFVCDPVAFTIRIGSFTWPIYWYGVIIALGLVLGVILAARNIRFKGGNPDDLVDMTLIVVPLAILGARLYYVAFMWDIYNTGPWYQVLYNIIAVWHGGLAIYGGIIGGFLGILIFSRMRKLDLLFLCDVIAPSLILGQAIGRWGNFVNQEAFGYQVNNPALQFFPFSVYIENLGQYHMATFFYESLWNFIVFAVLMIYLRKRKDARAGNVFWLYLMFYGLGRMFIEGLRTDSLYIGGTNLRVSQILSGVLVVGALVAFIILNRRRKAPEDGQDVPLDPSLVLVAADGPQDGEGAPLPQEPEEAPAEAGEEIADSDPTEETAPEKETEPSQEEERPE